MEDKHWIKKKGFWGGIAALIIFFVFAIIFDVIMASFILVKSLSSGQWSTLLLSLGLIYASLVVYRSYLSKEDQDKGKWFGRMLLVVIAILTFLDYGYFKMLYFLATVFIFSRFAKWISGLVVKRNRPRFKII
jgi:hypothetical protein